MQRRIEAQSFAGWRGVAVPPCVQQRIGRREDQASIRGARPFPINQAFTDIADVAEADPGDFRQLRDSPRTAGLTQQGAQHLGGFRPEQRLEFALFGHRFVRHHALDEYATEGDPGVSFQVEKADALLFAHLPHGRRDVGSDEDGCRLGGLVRNVVPQLQQR